jgi:hypothetical protein
MNRYQSFALSAIVIGLLAALLPGENQRPPARPADVEARLADVEMRLADALARLSALDARPAVPPRPGTRAGVLDPRAFGARGDGVTDDGPAIQRAIDAFVQVDRRTGVPNSGRVTHQLYANGGVVLLSPGTYKIVRPIKLWGMVTLAGNGRDTVIDATDVQGPGAIDLAGVELGQPGSGFANVWSGCRDLAIVSGGHGFFSSTGGCLSPRIERVQICSAGWGVYLPDSQAANCYAQDALIQDVHQFDPGSGGLLLRGNQNYVARYYVSSGTGGPRRAPYRSPWETDKLAIIDVGGSSNTLVNCHVEFNVGKTADGKPAAAVLSYAVRNGWAYLIDNWHEQWPVESFLAVGFSTLVDNARAYGQFEEGGAVVKYVNNGRRGEAVSVRAAK